MESPEPERLTYLSEGQRPERGGAINPNYTVHRIQHYTTFLFYLLRWFSINNPRLPIAFFASGTIIENP